MTANTSLNLVDLDFNSLKASFKNYLRDNNQFKDFDYEGSNINVLLDLLAYNSFKNAFFLNMVMSESFLDSAQLRNSVLSHAKELNYTPRSVRSSRARVKVVFTASGESAPYIIAKGSPLTALVKNNSYTFTIPQTLSVSSANSTYQFETDIFEGPYVQDTYVFQSTSAIQKFKLTNKNADTSSLDVRVYEDSNEDYNTYTMATSLLGLDRLSKVFFLQTSEDGYYEIIFGDNNLGRRPKTNSVIVLDYRVSSGSDANGARIFSLDFDPTNADELTNTPEVNVLQSSVDGASAETIDSIKYMAPRHFQTQERAVTATDYKDSLKAAFPEILNVHAFGGEDLSPPEYGKVYISVDVKDVEGLPDSKVRQYYNFIKTRSPFGIVPVFISPEFTYLRVNTNIRYNINITTDSSDTIKNKVKNSVLSFRDTFLGGFGVVLRHSKLESTIDSSDTSIISSVTETLVYKKINPPLDTVTNIKLNFDIALINNVTSVSNTHQNGALHAITSSLFTYGSETAKLEDDGQGNIRISKIKGDFHEKITDIGTVDYNTGVVILNNIKFDAYQDSAIKVFARPRDIDVNVKNNNILTIEPDEVNVSVEQLRE